MTLLPRPWLLVGSLLLVRRNTEQAMILLLVRDQLLGPKGALLLVDLLLVESSPPWCFALLVGSRLVDVPLCDTHGRDRNVANSSDDCVL
jgi:hypothetical protein